MYKRQKWAFGLAQSRCGYKTEADIREVAAQYKANGLPLDMICMDIDYMQSYADFTIDKTRFPDLGKLAVDLKAEGIRLVPIIDAGIRCDDNDPVCREGLEKGYFCTKEDGTPFVACLLYTSWCGISTNACRADSANNGQGARFIVCGF